MNSYSEISLHYDSFPEKVNMKLLFLRLTLKTTSVETVHQPYHPNFNLSTIFVLSEIKQS